jgi:hypothetical protein
VNAGNGAWQKSHRPAWRWPSRSRFGGEARVSSGAEGASWSSIAAISTVIDIVNTGPVDAHP